MAALICPTSRSQPVAGQPGLRLPPVPLATDLLTSIAAVNQMAGLLPLLTTPAPVNNVYPPRPFGNGPLTANNNGKGEPAQRWKEYSRATEIVRVTNPDNENNWVDLERITYISYRDLATGRPRWLEWRLWR